MKREHMQNEPNSTKQKSVSAERLISFRETSTPKKMTQADLAELLEVDVSTIKRWEGGPGISVPKAKILAEKTGVIKEYWLGATECKTQEDFDDECDSLALEEYGAELEREKQRITQIKTMLNFCGFGFENFRDTKYDFVDFSNDPELITEVQGAFNALTPYKITHIDKAVLPEPVYLSDDDLTALIREIGNCIGYSCYKKLNRNK